MIVFYILTKLTALVFLAVLISLISNIKPSNFYIDGKPEKALKALFCWSVFYAIDPVWDR